MAKNPEIAMFIPEHRQVKLVSYEKGLETHRDETRKGK